MRSLFQACAIVPAFVQASPAAPTVAEVQKAVVDGYAKLDRLSVACFLYTGGPGNGTTMGSIEYQFDRRAKQLAIGTRGIPSLLVKDNRAFLAVWCDEMNEVPTYLEVTKDRAITWKDIDEALQVIRKECPPYGQPLCASCFVAPFLEGGVERLFTQNTRVLLLDHPRKIADHPVDEEAIFGLGHPDFKRLIGGRPELPNLDPHKFPLCFKTEDGASSWRYAFDRAAGTLSAAIGTVDHKDVYGSPGNKVTVVMKRLVVFGEDRVVKDDAESREFQPVPLQLPKNAKTIAIADLKRSYLEAMAGRSLETFLKTKADIEEDLRTKVQAESDLLAKIAKQSAGSVKDPKALEEMRSQLSFARGDQETDKYVLAELQKLIDDLQKWKSTHSAPPH